MSEKSERGSGTSTKRRWISCFNVECERALREYLAGRNGANPDTRLFPRCGNVLTRWFRRASEESGVKITPQMLRDWFCSEMGELGVADRYVDAFCRRVPNSVLARHYTDFSSERLRRVYDRAGLKVLS